MTTAGMTGRQPVSWNGDYRLRQDSERSDPLVRLLRRSILRSSAPIHKPALQKRAHGSGEKLPEAAMSSIAIRGRRPASAVLRPTGLTACFYVTDLHRFTPERFASPTCERPRTSRSTRSGGSPSTMRFANSAGTSSSSPRAIAASNRRTSAASSVCSAMRPGAHTLQRDRDRLTIDVPPFSVCRRRRVAD